MGTLVSKGLTKGLQQEESDWEIRLTDEVKNFDNPIGNTKWIHFSRID